MAEAAAGESSGPSDLDSTCGSCPGDKNKECSQCSVQSPDKAEPTEGPKQNGTETIKEEPDSKAAEEIKIQEDLKESEDPKKPKEEPQEEVKEEPLGPGDVVCDSCIENPRRALKSCLTCLVSYCEAHLRPHLENPKFQNHRLVEPLQDIERRTCESHKWPLELFCRADACCICQDCVEEDHRGHNVVAVVEARRQIEVRGSGAGGRGSVLLMLLFKSSKMNEFTTFINLLMNFTLKAVVILVDLIF